MFDGLRERIAEPRGRYLRRGAGRPPLLLVHDDPWSRIALAQSLGTEFKVTATGDPHEALALTRPGEFALVVSAHRMSHMTGLELLEQLRARDPAMRRVLMSERVVAGLAGHLASGLLQLCVTELPSPAELKSLLS